jgi:hypothetical protein|tara:strand:- start:462 stop:776 length:315 start_codon:yes stop_codon:yes gene_type:complete
MSHIYQTPGQYISGCHPPADAQNGQIYFDSGLQTMVVYDGSGWITLTPAVTMLSFDADHAIESVISNLAGQKSLHDLADKYPLVAEAIGQLEVALKLSQNINNE